MNASIDLFAAHWTQFFAYFVEHLGLMQTNRERTGMSHDWELGLLGQPDSTQLEIYLDDPRPGCLDIDSGLGSPARTPRHQDGPGLHPRKA